MRARTYAAEYIHSDDPDSCSLRIVSQNAIRGYIPKLVVNFLAARMPNEWYEKMYKVGVRIRKWWYAALCHK